MPRTMHRTIRIDELHAPLLDKLPKGAVSSFFNELLLRYGNSLAQEDVKDARFNSPAPQPPKPEPKPKPTPVKRSVVRRPPTPKPRPEKEREYAGVTVTYTDVTKNPQSVQKPVDKPVVEPEFMPEPSILDEIPDF